MQTFNTYSNAELKESFLSGFLPAVAQDGLSSFLQKYGQRASGEIDAGRQRWKENPEYLFNVITSYLEIKDRKQAPDTIFAQSSKRAEHAINELTSTVKSCRLGWIKTRLVAFFAGRTRMLLGMRENPKFFFVRVMGILRDGLLEVGQEFVRSGALDSPDDLFFLSLSELEDFASNRQNDWRSMILQRRQTYSREFQRRLIPRLLVSDGRTFYEGIMSDSQEENGITGSPVSPGSVEGKVRVVFDPRQANLLPGEILVCPGTDPSWTPLFMAAGGLIMETGGMMTHGAVVAREYGIPAVVGVDQATIRLKTGQRILLNGSSGQIKLLDQPT
jgi:phosphohistidine swiveling domain-containing protein